MKTLLQQHPIAVLLGVLAAILAVLIALEAGLAGTLWPGEPRTSSKPGGQAETKLVPPLASVNPDQAFPETAARPLFTPTRRPAPAAPTVANNMVKGQFTLQGVIAVRDQRIALLREKSSGKVHRVEQGREVNGVTLATIDNDKVTLAQGGDQEVVLLQVQKGPAAPPAAAAPATASGGPFAPPPAPAQPPQAVGTQPVPQPTPAGTPPQVPPTAASAPANPTARSSFGPAPPGAAEGSVNQAVPQMTPEELLARRRARRAPAPNQ